MSDLLRQPQPSLEEFIFLIIIVAIFTGLLIFTDISIHVNYVGKIIAECYPSNTDNFCKMMRDYFKVPPEGQIQLGDAYWFVLSVQALTISSVMFLLRLMIAKLAGVGMKPLVFFTAILWGFTTYAFYLFGFLDWGYYALRGLPIPDHLEWLDGVGLFRFVQNLGETKHVDKTDLYILMAIGTFLVIGLQALVIHKHKKGELRRLGLV